MPFKRVRKLQSLNLPIYIRWSVAKKRLAWRRFKRTGDPAASARFKALSAHVHKLIKAHEIESDQAALNNVSLKNFYRVLSKRLYPSHEGLPLCDATGSPIISDDEKAKVCCDAFVANFCNDGAHNIHIPFQAGFDINVTHTMVASYLSKIKLTSSSGPDSIPNVFLRCAAQGLLRPLTVIFQRSVFEARIPDAWRSAKVVPLYKGKGDKADPNSYRPISLTSCVGKVLERIIKDQCLQFVNQNKLLSDCQHGFVLANPQSLIYCVPTITYLMKSTTTTQWM